MRKLKLDLDLLRVDTFAPAEDEPRERGTVRGHWSMRGTCDVATCQPGGTCANNCGPNTDPRYCI
jgi:hypothetical protein